MTDTAPRTHWVPTWHLPALLTKLKRMAKKGERYDVPVTWTVGEPEKRSVYVHCIGPDAESYYRKATCYPVQVSAELVAMKGWLLVGQLDFTLGDTPIIRTVPGREVPDLKPTPGCDHCHRRGVRYRTYVVQNEQTGEYRQVGSTCVADYLGWDPVRTAALATMLVEDWRFDDDDEGRNWKSKPYAFVEEIVTMAACFIRGTGWISRSDQRAGLKDFATADFVEDGLFDPKAWEAVTKEDKKLAQDTLEHVRGIQNPRSDYVQNLTVLANYDDPLYGRKVIRKNLGLVCSMIPFYQRAMEQEAERKRKAAAAGHCNEHLGEVGQRLEVTAYCESVRFIEGYYGATALHRFRDPDGRLLVWFCGGRGFDAEVGQTYKLRGTVKRHDDYKGTAQTILTRCVRLKEAAA